MKHKTILFVLFLSVTACAIKKQTADIMLPDAMLPQVKTEYKKVCEKGQVLYNINCSRCHNVTIGRKEFIPDFNPDKFSGYILSNSSAQHAIALPDSVMSSDELGCIITFLTYKKNNGVTNKLISTDNH